MQRPFHKEATPGQVSEESHDPAEKVLWDYLKNNRFKGAKFRRQHPVGF
jgi:very-short-patch-repair endonuclease